MKNNINLTEYILERAYGKTDTYSKSDLDALLSSLNESTGEIFKLVDELPLENIEENKLYLVYNGESDDGNLFDVFLYVNGEWEQLDGLNFKISDYYTQSQMNSLLDSKATVSQLNVLNTDLISVRDNLTTLYSHLIDFNEALIDFNEDDEVLSEDLSQLKDNLENFLTRVEGLIDGVSELEEALGNEEENSGLVGELRSTQQELSTLQEELIGDDGLSNGLNNLRSDLDETKESLSNVQDDITDLQTEDENVTAQISELSLALNGDGTGENKGVVNSLRDLKNDVSDLDTELETTNSVLNTTKDLVDSTQDDIHNLQVKDTELTGELDNLKIVLDGDDTAEPPVKGLKENLSETSDDLSDLKEEFDALSDDFDITKDTLEDTNGTLTDTKNLSLNLRNQLIGNPNVEGDTGLTGKVNVLESNLGTLEDSTARLDGSLSSLDGRLSVTESTLSNTNSNLDNLHDTLVGDDENGGLRKQLNDFEDNLEGLSSSASSLDSRLTNLDSRLSTTESSLSTTEIGLNNVKSELLGNDYPNTTGGLKKGLSDLSDDVSSLDTEISGLKEADQNLQEGISGLSVELNGDANNPNDTGGLKGELTSINTLLNGDEEDETDTGLRGQLITLQSQTGAMNVNLTKLTTGLFDANGELKVTGDQILIFSQELDEFLLDLGTLSNSLTNFEGSLTEFKEQNSDIDLKTFDLDSGIVDLFALIGTVRLDVSTLDNTINDEDNGLVKHISDVQETLYGDSENPNDNGVVGTISDVQDDITLINETTIPSVNNKIDTVDGKVDTAKGRIDTIVNTTIPTVQGQIDTVDGRVDSVNNVIGDKNSKTGLFGEIDNVDSKIDTIDEKIGDDTKGLIKDINQAKTDINNAEENISQAQSDIVDAQNSIAETETTLYGDGGTSSSPKTNSLVNYVNLVQSDISQAQSDINQAQLDISNVQSDITTVQSDVSNVQSDIDDTKTTLYGSSTGSSTNYSTDSLMGGLDTVNTIIDNDDTNNPGLVQQIDTANSQINNARSQITNVNSEIVRVEGKVDSTQEQLEDSMETIQTVSNILNGGLREEIHPTNSFTEYTIDTSDLKGEFLLKLLASDDNNYRIRSVEYTLNPYYVGDSPIVDFEFVEDLTYWNPSTDDTDRVNINNQVLSLNNRDGTSEGVSVSQLIDFTYVESITYEIKSTRTEDALFLILIGDTGVLDTLTSYDETLISLDNQLNSLDTGLTEANNQINTLDGKVDRTQGQLEESIKYINNVQKIVYGDNTYYYPVKESEWSNIIIDTTEIIGEEYLKFITYPINEILIQDIKGKIDDTYSFINNGNFSNGLTGWNITNDSDITVNENICKLKSISQVMVLCQKIDFTNITELSFKIKADDENPLTDITNGLFVYIGEEETNTGLLETLTNFSVSLENTRNDLNTANNKITIINETTIPNVQGQITTINETTIPSVNNKIDGAVNSINTINNTTIPNVESQVSNVKNIVTGDPNDTNDTGLIGEIGNVQSDINNITNSEGTGSLNVLQKQMYGGASNTGSVQNPANGTVMKDISNSKNSINKLDNDMGTVKFNEGGNLQSQIATLLTLLGNILNCIVVDTVYQMENLNLTYADYCYVKETGKYYQYMYYIKYFDSNGNEVEPQGGPEIVLADEASSEELNDINNNKTKLGESRLYG